MPFGTEVGLGSGHNVLTGTQPPIFGPCLLWPNGWMDQDATWCEGRSRPRPHCVTWGSSSPPEGTAPTVRPMSIVAKRSPISATAEHLLWSPYGIGQTIIFLPCGYFFLSFFLSSPNLSRCRLDVCHTSTHGVALVRI